MQEEQKNSQDSEFMLEPVPENKRRSYCQSSNGMDWVWICSYRIDCRRESLGGYGGGGGLPPAETVLAIVLGMGSLFLITSFLGIAAQKTGLNLSLLSRYSYGKKGMIIPMLVMALLTLGWFASILGMIGDIWGAWIGNPSGIIIFDPADLGFQGVAPITLEVFLACFIWGIIFTVTAIKGMGAIEKVANVTAPLILFVAIAVGVVFIQQSGGVSSFLDKASEL